MPCNSDYMIPTPAENELAAELERQYKRVADETTHALDMLRECALGADPKTMWRLLSFHPEVTLAALDKQANQSYLQPFAGIVKHAHQLNAQYADLLQAMATGTVDEEAVRTEQVAHRKLDLARLLRELRAAGDTVRLRKVLDADPTQPLAPQLGFDPNDF